MDDNVAAGALRYQREAQTVWGDQRPTLGETRVHAKCLRSLPLVRDYFRNYRQKKTAAVSAPTVRRRQPAVRQHGAGIFQVLTTIPGSEACVWPK